METRIDVYRLWRTKLRDTLARSCFTENISAVLDGVSDIAIHQDITMEVEAEVRGAITKVWIRELRFGW